MKLAWILGLFFKGLARPTLRQRVTSIKNLADATLSAGSYSNRRTRELTSLLRSALTDLKSVAANDTGVKESFGSYFSPHGITEFSHTVVREISQGAGEYLRSHREPPGLMEKWAVQFRTALSSLLSIGNLRARRKEVM